MDWVGSATVCIGLLLQTKMDVFKKRVQAKADVVCTKADQSDIVHFGKQ